MLQYNAIKAKHPDAILLFRVGDFYETFSDDAIKASAILGITLTKRANGSASYVELAGFPYHSLDTYLPKLVRAGQRVAICEQLEDPKKTKKIVKRGVTELVTPGITTSDKVLEHKENNYLSCVHLSKNISGVAFLDLSTGEFYTTQGSSDYIDKLLNSFAPKEVLFERSKQNAFKETFGTRFYTYPLEDWVFTPETARERLLKQFDTNSLKGFGIHDLPVGVTAAGAILQYLDLTHHDRTNHITRLSRIDEGLYVWLDKFTIRNLELFNTINNDGKTLFNVLDKTISPMGARMLKRWIALPLKNVVPINNRLNGVSYFVQNSELKEHIQDKISNIGDLERLVSKVALMRITPREVLQVKNALAAITPIKIACSESTDSFLYNLAEQLNPCSSVYERIDKELNNEPPAQIQKGNVIAKGVSQELDELRELAYSGKDYLAKMQEKEAKVTGISSLKISFNNVFGYYFEVRNTYKNRVPDTWIRKQTLVSAERYINEELKEYEGKILGAEEKIQELEVKLFNDLVHSLNEFIPALQLNASLIAQFDCLLSFATIAIENNYVKAVVSDNTDINIKQGRHPVIEKQLPVGEEYIANDVFLDTKSQQVIVITGPNMSGKSALLRQTALIVLMAQIGSFVPAKSAEIGIVDKIFTRVGASDNISSGESTFMVEMNEAASILNNLSERSLILFDELGRGTSTYDGISIAWAIVEHIHNQKKYKAKTLFATHYHELNEMEKSFKRIKNYNVSVKEIGSKIVFLRKLERGGSEHSFGIHVARMAGMPQSVVNRSNEILQQLEQGESRSNLSEPIKKAKTKSKKQADGYQLSIFQLDDPVLSQIRDEIKTIDINNLTPIEALNKLSEIKRITGV